MKIERGVAYPKRLVVEALIRKHSGNRAANEYRRKEQIKMATAAKSKKWTSASAPFPQDADDDAPDDNAPYQADFNDDDAVLNYDIAGAADSGGTHDLIAPGVHPAFIKSIAKENSKAGNPQFKIVLQVQDGPEEGKSRPTYIGLDPKFAWKLKQLLAAIAVPPSLMNTMSVNKIKDAALDTMVAITVKPDSWVVTNEDGTTEVRPSCNIDRIDDPSAFGIPPGAKVQDAPA